MDIEYLKQYRNYINAELSTTLGGFSWSFLCGARDAVSSLINDESIAGYASKNGYVQGYNSVVKWLKDVEK
jgi:hypothetical protein